MLVYVGPKVADMNLNIDYISYMLKQKTWGMQGFSNMATHHQYGSMVLMFCCSDQDCSIKICDFGLSLI